jgi:hypothetical protein
VRRCEFPGETDSPGDTGTFSRTELAGDIAVQGTRVGGGVVLKPVDDRYEALFTEGSLWSGPGERLTFSATGGAVPAFSGKTLVTPPRLTVTVPGCPASPCTLTRSSSPFTLSWTGGSTSEVLVGIVTTGDPQALMCSFVASEGPGSIPATLLGLLLPGSGSLTVVSSSWSRFRAGEFDVTLNALDFEPPIALTLR